MSEDDIQIDISKLPPRLLLFIGQFILEFSKTDLLISNCILINTFDTKEEYFQQINNKVSKEYFKFLLTLNFESKLKILKKKLDVSALKDLGEFRNSLAHGLIHQKKDNLFLKKTKINGDGHLVDEKYLEEKILALDIETRKIVKVMEDKV